jgi:ABC-type branched-subunit amino acid transport system substrate-binding protein
MADTGSQAIPGMANGSLEAVQAWAKLMNDGGGLACRKVQVRTFDSKIDPNESRNGYTDGCQNAFAMVGTFALSVADVSQLKECPDKSGAKTGLPEVPAVIQSSLHGCNATTFPVAGNGQPCPPTQGARPITVATAMGDYIKQVVGSDAHGIFVVANTSPATAQSVMPGFRAMETLQGLKADQEVGAKGSDPQSHYTPFATTIHDKKSNFVVNTATFPGFILLRKEAAAQGDSSVKLWLCQATCYDPAFPRAGGNVVTGTQVTLAHLPYEESAQNAEVKMFVDLVKTHNTFSETSWVAARLFQQAVEDVVKVSGPNGLTRASLLEALAKVKEFDNHGMISKTTPSARAPSPCIVVVELQADSSFKRVFPTAPGTFSCKPTATINIDPATAFQG